MNLGLAGKVALVFGGSRGIGAASARALGAEGAKLALTARSVEALEAITGELPDILSLAADLTQVDAAQQVVRATLDRYSRLDLAVISAGAAQGGDFEQLDDEIWTEALSLKFMGMIRALRALIPAMRGSGGGRIVVIVGNNGRQPNGKMLPGSAANAACLAVVRGLADEVARDNIRINALNPGPTRTDRWQGLIQRLSAAQNRPFGEVEREMLSAQPLGRIAEADEMGRLAVLMLSDAADMLVGASLTADGGATKGIG